MDAIGNNRGSDIELELEKMLYQTKDKTREKFLYILRNVTRNRRGRYTTGIDREEILDNLEREGTTDEWTFVEYIFRNIDNADYEKALHWSDRLLKMNNKLWTGYMLKGNILHLIGKNSEAIDSYLKAISLNKLDSNSYFLLADIYKATNERELAIKNYESGIKYSKSLINQIIAAEKIKSLSN
ncbi:tetratricopeptide repeat protein [Leptospira interrogans]|uniref:tetratricopeptide repeat protein n=1 Tax=Leptospira interrogans TaxID=173 RepID=UPI0002983616|nr:tetratricopeptide repeat protein [Leptospira interrogans]EKR16765.1 tetratricopeptide repeat protein [Leptospira interrogans serovar Pyrogenes str. 2006006960]